MVNSDAPTAILLGPVRMHIQVMDRCVLNAKSNVHWLCPIGWYTWKRPMTKEKRKSLEKSTQLNCVKNAKHWGDHAGSKPLFIIVNDDRWSFYRLSITIVQNIILTIKYLFRMIRLGLQCNLNLNIQVYFKICMMLNLLSHIQCITCYK